MPKLPHEHIERLQFLVNFLVETDKDVFQSTNPKVMIYVLDTSNLGITYQGKNVKNIRYIAETVTAENSVSNVTNIERHFVLSLLGGEKIRVTASPLVSSALEEFQKTLVSLFLEYGRLDVHVAMSSVEKIPWSKIPLEEAYQKTQLEQNYQDRYQLYAQQIWQIIREDQSNRPILLIEPGCGDGRCSEFITHYIKTKVSREVCIAGFDVNAENIEHAKAKFSDTQHYFAAHDFSQMESFISGVHSMQSTLQNPLTIVIFSGVLCSFVATGSRQSLQLIQQACRELSPSLMVIGNLTDTFVNMQMIKRTGMQIVAQCYGPQKELQGTEIKTDSMIYFLQPLSDEQYALKHRNWSDKRGQNGQSKRNLDLSMCPHPLKALHNLVRYDEPRYENVTQLDLSDALIKPQDIEELVKLIHQKLPKLLHVLFTKTDSWSISLAYALRVNFPKLIFVNRLDSPNAESLPPFSVPMARKIKLFSTVPNAQLILPEPPQDDVQLKPGASIEPIHF